MYKNGELQEVMADFEKAIIKSTTIICRFDLEVMVEKTTEEGLITKRYVNGRYCQDGATNDMFNMYLTGYAHGKCVGRME